jgi:hypothetical protein
MTASEITLFSTQCYNLHIENDIIPQTKLGEGVPGIGSALNELGYFLRLNQFGIVSSDSDYYSLDIIGADFQEFPSSSDDDGSCDNDADGGG